MILKFRDKTERRAFLDLVGRERPDIGRLCREARVLPHIVVDTDDDGEPAAWIHDHLSRFSGQAYANITFDIFR